MEGEKYMFKYLQIILVSLLHNHITICMNSSLGFGVINHFCHFHCGLFHYPSDHLRMASLSIVNDCDYVEDGIFSFNNLRLRWLVLFSNCCFFHPVILSVSFIRTLSLSLKDFVTCPVQLFF